MMIFKLLPKRRAVLGWRKLSFSSSSLFGAISNAICELYDEDVLYKFFESYRKGDVCFSSVFPMISDGGGNIYFFPRPILSFRGERELQTRRDAKRVKRVKWLSLDAFKELLSSVRLDNHGDYFHAFELSSCDIFWGDRFCAVKDVVPKDIRRRKPFEVVETPHASIDRLISSSNLFFSEEIFVYPPLGFFFLCRSSDEWKERLINAVRFLAEEGLGGGRNEGKGAFDEMEVEEKDLFEDMDNPVGYVGLSLVYPAPSEINFLYSISLVKDDGFVYASRPVSLKKSRLMMLEEGCVYRGKVEGALLEEKGGNLKVLRNGRAFLVPVGGKK